MSDGSIRPMKDKRINGVGVEKYIQEQGYIVAPEGHSLAEKLADYIDAREGLEVVENQSNHAAGLLQEKFAGQVCTYIPFDPKEAGGKVVIAEPNGFRVVALGLRDGISCGCVRTDYHHPSSTSNVMDIHLDQGWIVPEGQAAQPVPRLTEYGGLVEHACFVMANAGLATLEEPYNMDVHLEPAVDDSFPRGLMRMSMNNGSGDRIVVGIDAGDELVVQYLRNNELFCQRRGLLSFNGRLNLGSAVGSIVAVIVKANRLEATAVQPKRKKTV